MNSTQLGTIQLVRQYTIMTYRNLMYLVENTILGSEVTGTIMGNPISMVFGTGENENSIITTDFEDFMSTDRLYGVKQIEATFESSDDISGGMIRFDINWDDQVITPYTYFEGQTNIIEGDDLKDDNLHDWITDDIIYGYGGDDFMVGRGY